MEQGDEPQFDIDTRLLRTFAVAAREGSFTGAAAHLFLTQQGVSNHVRRLEAVVGQSLFERRDSGVVLTTAGVSLLEHARRVLVATDNLFVHLRESRPPLRLAEIRGRRMMQEIWRVHHRDHPRSAASFRDLTGDQQVEALLDGRIDVAMTLVRHEIPGLSHQPLRYDPVVAVHVRPQPGIKLRGSTQLAYPSVPGSFETWHAFCELLSSELGVHLEQIAHDITMLEVIGQEQIRQEAPPILALEGMSDYPGADAFHFEHFADIQPYYPWSLIWRREEMNKDVLAFVDTARKVSEQQGWLGHTGGAAQPWLPTFTSSTRRTQ